MGEISADINNKFWMDIGEKINKISDDIEKGEGNECANFYVRIDDVANYIRDKLSKETPELDCSQMPVPINLMAQKLGISLGNLPLTYEQRGGSRRITQLRMSDNPIIFVDSEASEEEIRYAIAFEIGHFMSWFRKESEEPSNKKSKHTYTLIPMIPNGPRALVADALAISLLVPFDNFCKEFDSYIKNNKKRNRFILTEEWLEYLAERAGISFCNMAIGYQQLRYIALSQEKKQLLDENIWKEICPEDE